MFQAEFYFKTFCFAKTITFLLRKEKIKIVRIALHFLWFVYISEILAHANSNVAKNSGIYSTYLAYRQQMDTAAMKATRPMRMPIQRLQLSTQLILYADLRIRVR